MSQLPTEWTPFGQVQAPRFQENLDRLARVRPDLHTIVAPHLSRTDLVLRENSQGEIQVRQHRPDGQIWWIAGRESLEAEIHELSTQAQDGLNQGADLILCFGVGLGYIPLRVARAVWMQDRCLVVIERDPGVLLGMLAIHEIHDVLPMPNVSWVLGEENIRSAGLMLRNGGLHRQAHCTAIRGALPRTPSEQASDEQIVQGVVNTLTSLADEHEQREQRLAGVYAPNTKRGLRKILILDMWQDAPGGKHLRCLEEALVEEGYEVHYQVLPRTGWALKYPGHVRRASGPILELIDRLQPDLVLSMELYCCRFLPESSIDRIGVPCLTIVTSYNGLEWRVSNRERIVVMEAGLARWLNSHDYPGLSTVLPAASVERRRASPPPWPYGNLDLTYFGNYYWLDPDEYRRRFASYAGLYDHLQDVGKEIAKPDSRISVYDIADKQLGDWDMPREEQIAAQIYADHVGTGIRRLAMVRALLEYGIRVIGNYWPKVLTPEELDRCYLNPLPVTQEENVYLHSQININVHTCGNEYCPNHRFFNVQAAGAFQISDDCRDFSRLYEPDKEVVLYRTVDEMKAAVERYRDDPNARQAIAEAGRERTLREHTYRHRLREFLPIMREVVEG